ncbi:hypothetical protein L4D76_23590 [Photobacterium sagamiensis]|uniref:type I-F CRISPR-associated protein Csy2 n=1 Tax=Photobacterium sagamiensis TaxID=2910241 RepID=UPI003D0A26D0
MTNFNELIELPNDENKIKALRSAFEPATLTVDITENPNIALTVLVNLTEKRERQKDLLDKNTCKEKLRNEAWWRRCLKTAKFRHTHNLKFPDYRATGVIRLEPINKLPDFMFSSSKNDDNTFGYAQNSRDINAAILLCSDFIWQGATLSLALALTDTNHSFWKLLKKLGCTEKNKKFALRLLARIPAKCASVNLYPNYLPQVRLPLDEHEYISLTPVASHRVQAAIHRVLEPSSRITGFHRCSRATNVGNLVTATGAKINQIRTPPKLRYTQQDVSQNQSQWMNRERFNALIELNRQRDWLTTSNKHKQLKIHYQMLIKAMLLEWVADRGIPQNTTPSALAQTFNFDLSKLKQGHRVSYQPALIQFFEHVFASTDTSAISPTQKLVQKKYLVIPNIHVSNANAESSAYTVGLPSLIGFYGFIHAFERRLESKHAIKTRANAFAICMHTYHLQKRGLTKEAIKYVGGHIKSPGIVDGWQCDFTFSLVLKLESLIEFDLDAILSSLPKRLCRGNLHIKIADIPDISLQSTVRDAVKHIQIESGRWLSQDTSCTQDSAESLIEYCNNRKNRILTCTGYHLLEQPQNRNHALDNNLHAFCEPIISAVQLVPFTSSTDQNQFLWTYRWAGSGPLITSIRSHDETT